MNVRYLLSGLTRFATMLAPPVLRIALATRFSALALLIMTAVIQLVAPGGWETYHLPWAAMALSLMALGPGRLSLDSLLVRQAPVPVVTPQYGN